MRIRGLLMLLILFTGCKSAPELADWEGRYFYEEEPVQALAGYSMAMLWNLTISQEKGEYVGELEINGQQTAMKIKTSIEGNKDQVEVKFTQGLEGFGFAQLKPGDILFTLHKNKESDIFTVWQKLEPRLSEKHENGKEYFIKEKKI